MRGASLRAVQTNRWLWGPTALALLALFTVSDDALLSTHGAHFGVSKYSVATLGLPALVIGQPSNLSPFVDEGVMLGADDEAGINQVLHRLLYDREVLARLRAATEAFVERYDLKARGTAALRAAGAILEMKPR